MNKSVIALIGCVLVVICIIAYEPKKEEFPELPEGVYSHGSTHYYIVELPEDKKVEDFFVLEGSANKVAVAVTDVSSYHKDLGVIYYQQVLGGGWVAYIKSQTERFLYMPDDFPKDDLLRVSSRLAMNIANGGICMSIDEAERYILPMLG